MYKMLQLVIFDKRLTVLIFITLTLSVSQQSNQIDCQLIGDLTTSSKLFSDLSTGGSIFRHILSYVESGRNFLSSTTSLSDHSESSELITTLSPATTTESIVKPVLTESSTLVPEKKDNPEYGIKQISEINPIINSFKTPLIDTLKQKVPSPSFRPFSFNLFKRDPVKEELQLRLEYIKMKILHKLGLNRAPSIRPKMDHEAYSQILELRQLHSDPNKNQASRQDYYDMDETDESDKLFLLPIKSGSSSATFNMTLDIDIKRYPFRKVTLFTKMSNSESNDKTISLMLTKKRSDSTTNSSYDDHFERIKPINDGASNPLRYTDNTLNDEYEWREYDLSQLILKYKWNQLEGQPMIVIETLTSSAKLHSSLMTIEFNYISASRRRRKVDCNATKNTSSCCRESFYVNFTQIGWDNWIVQPPGYYANYCKGKCDISHARYHHTTVVQKYSSIINLCCSPREMSNISLIYVNESGYLFQKNLANMVVESCDCA